MSISDAVSMINGTAANLFVSKISGAVSTLSSISTRIHNSMNAVVAI